MKYFTSFLAENSGSTSKRDPLEPLKPTEGSEEPAPQNSGDSYFYEPLEPLKPPPDDQTPSFSGSSGSGNQVCPEISVVRRTVARWPIPLRERWGRRANDLADAGVPHPDDEIQAFLDVRDGTPEETP